MRPVRVFLLVVAMAPALSAPAHAQLPTDERTITYLGATLDTADLRGFGSQGYWFANWDAPVERDARPTDERDRDRLPAWVAPLNHVETPTELGCTLAEIAQGCLPTYLFRSFSQDGPARSFGGQPGWSTLTLPRGETGLSGAVVDPQTAGGVNNTINRIQLLGDVPESFLFHVVVDTTGGEHDPTGQIRARGNAGPLDTDVTQVDTEVFPQDLAFNGVPDIHTFRYDGFTSGDYLKLRLEGGPGGASFAGVLFDAP